MTIEAGDASRDRLEQKKKAREQSEKEEKEAASRQAMFDTTDASRERCGKNKM